MSRLRALFPYREHSVVGQLIHTYKYQGVRALESVIARWIAQDLAPQVSLREKIDVIVAVPLHPRRLAERGFSQSHAIAALVGESLCRPVVNDLVERIRYTKPQVTLGRDDRAANVEGAFFAPSSPNGVRILIVDDVYTTGATMQECARVLRDAGAALVEGFVLARG